MISKNGSDSSFLRISGHLAVEKFLKAIFVRSANFTVPRTHNLSRLAKDAGTEMNEVQQSALIRITGFNLESRYSDYKKEFRKKCTRQFTRRELEKIREFSIWLKSKL